MFLFEYFDSRDRARLARVESKLDSVLASLTQVKGLLMANQDELNTLTAQVTKMENAQQSATALIQNMAEMIRQAADDPQEIRALADRLERSATTLGDAVAANTPGGEPTPEDPTPPEEDESGFR